jgi:lysozyme
MVTSDKGIELISVYEGLRLTAYLCPAKVWTIGYGHTATAKEGMTITRERAKELLKQDVNRFEKYITRTFQREFLQHEFDALVSFCFNLGSIYGNMRTSLKNQDNAWTVEMFSRYVKGGGRYLLGLHRRRLAEAYLFAGINLTEPELKSIRQTFTTEQINQSFKELINYVRQKKNN